jgi:hypothetical protein
MAEVDLGPVYRAPPEEFVARRAALVAELEAEGRHDDAAAVGRARKPTVAAWALDRLAAEDPDRIEALIASGAALQDAQREVLAGAPATALHDAAAARRTIVAELVDRASSILRAEGKAAEPHRDDLEGTLEAASVDPELGRRLRHGTLERAARPATGLVSGLSIVDAAGDEPTGEAPPRSKDERRRELDERIGSLRSTLKDRDRSATRARKVRDRAAGAADTAQARLEAARASLRAAEAELGATELEAKRTRRSLERAERDRDRLR